MQLQVCVCSLLSYWKELCRNVHNNYLVGVLQQIVDNCVGGAGEDLETL